MPAKKHKGFFILEEVPSAPPYIFVLADAHLLNPYFKNTHKLKVNTGDSFSIFENYTFKICHNLNSLRRCAQGIFDKIMADPQWGIRMDDRILKTARAYMDYSKKLYQSDIQTMSNNQLFRVSEQWFYKYFRDSWMSGWPAVLVDFERNLFSNHLLNYLKSKIKEKNYPESVGDIFSVLTTPLEESFAQKESASILKLLAKVKKERKIVKLITSFDSRHVAEKWRGIDIATWRAFEKHFESYRWLPFMYTGPAWGREYFIESLAGLLHQRVNPEKELKRGRKKRQKTAHLQKRYAKDLHIHGEYGVLFDIARRFVFSKGFRKDAMYYSCYVLNFLLEEIARRTYLSLKQVHHAYPWEIKNLLARRGPSADVLNERAKFAIMFSTTKSRKNLEGKEARAFLRQMRFVKQKQARPREVLGDCACAGKARGIARIINTPKDMDKMKENNILISYATSPDIVPAIKKASAIVTDLGGITCHAAIISRELRIPCVVGTKSASTTFADGDIVEVDANHGIARLIKKAK